MRISVLQESLAHALDIVAPGVAVRSMLPILECVLLSADDDCMTLTTTNLEMCIAHRVPSKIEEPGAIAVPARTLNDLVKELQKVPVNLDTNDETATLHLDCGRTHANVKGQAAPDFQRLGEAADWRLVAKMDQVALAQAVANVAYAASADEAKPILTGVLLAASENDLTLAAADGFRLAEFRTSAEVSLREGEETVRLIVPARALAYVARLCGKEGELTIKLNDGGTLAQFEVDETTIVVSLIAGAFPDYSGVIRSAVDVEGATSVTVDVSEIEQAAKPVSVFARDSAKVVRCALQADPDSGNGSRALFLRGLSAESGENTSKVIAEADGPDVAFALNVRFLRDVLRSFPTAQLQMQVVGPSSPVGIVPTNGHRAVSVIMPMQLDAVPAPAAPAAEGGQ
jgi:DNA polymerase-3 subunit beta